MPTCLTFSYHYDMGIIILSEINNLLKVLIFNHLHFRHYYDLIVTIRTLDEVGSCVVSYPIHFYIVLVYISKNFTVHGELSRLDLSAGRIA